MILILITKADNVVLTMIADIHFATRVMLAVFKNLV